MGEERTEAILATIRQVENSGQSVREYFETHDAGFSRVQYYAYRKALKERGEAGLSDKRKAGNYRKVTQEIREYLRMRVEENPSISERELREAIEKRFKTTISKATLNNLRKSEGLQREHPDPKTAQSVGIRRSSGGGEIFTSLVFYSGILEVLTATIVNRLEEVRQSRSFKPEKGTGKDHPRSRNHGQFTREYNQLKSVRVSRFKSIEEKIPKKNFSTMDVFRRSEETLSRYNLALLCLPLVTSNGKSSRVNRVKGNDLKFLCGYNYKDAALDKYLRELKYLKISEHLIVETAAFWLKFWKDRYGEESVFVCYYIDGNTKALWSSQRCYKGKVTMLGRVMGCLENVFIHDGRGHPLYFQTFQGHADLGKHALGMITELTRHFDDSQVTVRRILVIDGGGNSVKAMRGFQDSEENFITILDKNQVKERRFKHKQKPCRYRFGDAELIDCRIELCDSTDQNSIYESRAVIVRWGNGRESVLVTDIPLEVLDASEVTKRYFDRWPMQEKRFRDSKEALNIHRIVGYGKRVENYDSMKEKHTKLRRSIAGLRKKLRTPLGEIETIELELKGLYLKERKLRENSRVEKGTRRLGAMDEKQLKACEKEINRCLRAQKAVEKEHGEDFAKLKKDTKEAERIRLKDKVYRIDTELDQLLTCFKLSFANLCSLLLSECMNHARYEMLTLFESIFQLNGYSLVTTTEKCINLERNPKEPKVMKVVGECMKQLNSMGIQDLQGHTLRFVMHNG